MRAAEPQLGAEEERRRNEEPSEREAVSREERSRAAAAERVATEKRARERREQRKESEAQRRFWLASIAATPERSRAEAEAVLKSMNGRANGRASLAVGAEAEKRA
jgi:hypothetical protein